MLILNNSARKSGKTTDIIKIMTDDQSVICLVPLRVHKTSSFTENRELWDRIYTFEDFLDYQKLAGKGMPKSVVIDETFYASKTQLIKLYYRLGQLRISVTAFGTDMETQGHRFNG